MMIVSGGQAGADLGGIAFAVKHKIPCEIRTCRDFRPVRGRSLPKDVPVAMVSQARGVPGLRARTRYNVEHSDVTLILLRDTKRIEQTRGSQLTYNEATRLNKPCGVFRMFEWMEAGAFLMNYASVIRHGVLNVAGERYLDEERVRRFLEMAWPTVLGGKQWAKGERWP